MRHKPKLQILILCAVVNQLRSTLIDSNDLLAGAGLFATPSISGFHLDQTHSTSFVSWGGNNILKLQKGANEQVSYKQGLKYVIPPSKIRHVQFKFASTTPDVEDCNLRIFTDNDTANLIVFRAGRGGLIRVNEKQMIGFYNNSISTDTDIRLTQVDLVVDWEHEFIQIFIDGKFKDKCNFFQTPISSVSNILLYNLYSSSSYWSDLVVCSDICYSFNTEFTMYILSWSFLIILLACF